MGSNSENATCCNEYNQLNIKLYHRGVYTDDEKKCTSQRILRGWELIWCLGSDSPPKSQ